MLTHEPECAIQKPHRRILEVQSVLHHTVAVVERDRRTDRIVLVRDLRVAFGALVVRVWNAAELVKPVPRRTKLPLLADMPFANQLCGVPALLEQRGRGLFLRTKAD